MRTRKEGGGGGERERELGGGGGVKAGGENEVGVRGLRDVGGMEEKRAKERV